MELWRSRICVALALTAIMAAPAAAKHIASSSSAKATLSSLEADMKMLVDDLNTMLATTDNNHSSFSHSDRNPFTLEEEDDTPGITSGGPFLIVLDCGSSGTKFLMYTRDAESCPAGEIAHLITEKVNEGDMFKFTDTQRCEDVKIKPTLSKVHDVQMGTVNQGYLQRINLLIQSVGKANFAGYLAGATAGNRIVDKDADAVSFERLNDYFRNGLTGKITTELQLISPPCPNGASSGGACIDHPGYRPKPLAPEDQFPIADPTNFPGRTLPGTQEAFLEYFATAKFLREDQAKPPQSRSKCVDATTEENGDDCPPNPNFFSLGGASAQMAIALDSEALVTAAGMVVESEAYVSWPVESLCNNQDQKHHFFKIIHVEGGALNPQIGDYNSDVTDSVVESCADGKCVALISWLAGVADETKNGCPVVPAPTTAGASATASAVTATGGDGSCTRNSCFNTYGGVAESVLQYKANTGGGAACLAGSTFQGCLEDMTGWAMEGEGRNAMTLMIQPLVEAVVSSDAFIYMAGNMANSHKQRVEKGYLADNVAIRDCGNYDEPCPPVAFFQLWGAAFAEAVGIPANKLRHPAGKIDWADAAAATQGFFHKCPIGLPTWVDEQFAAYRFELETITRDGTLDVVLEADKSYAALTAVLMTERDKVAHRSANEELVDFLDDIRDPTTQAHASAAMEESVKKQMEILGISGPKRKRVEGIVKKLISPTTGDKSCEFVLPGINLRLRNFIKQKLIPVLRAAKAK